MIPESKEDILYKHLDGVKFSDDDDKAIYDESVYDAMDEHAKNIAIGFYMWAVTEAFKLDKPETRTPEELFTQYIKTLKP